LNGTGGSRKGKTTQEVGSQIRTGQKYITPKFKSPPHRKRNATAL